MNKIDVLRGSAVPLLGDDIDTDQIIPARFLKEITFEKMGEYLFYDARFEEKGALKSHPLNESCIIKQILTHLLKGNLF
jgi:3-isopropylmalate/(R)-2-methylmalate dehydratase small subunit